MSEEQAVYDPVNHEGSPEERLMRLECVLDELLQYAVTHQKLDKSVDDLRRRISDVDHRVSMLQDANLAPLLESSALLAELRRIADALENLRSDATYSPPKQTPWCDELWRLAQEWERSLGNYTITAPKYALRNFVREHS